MSLPLKFEFRGEGMTAPVIIAEGLSKHYKLKGGLFGINQIIHALTDTRFSLLPGRTLGVVGVSRCGKSTLTKLVTMIEETTRGSLELNGKQVDPSVWASLRSSVQIVFQDPYGSLNPRQRVGTILEEPLKINKPEMTNAERTEKGKEMLGLVGLRPEHYDRYPHMFSGGQRQRIAVARALMLSPKVLVLDEPVSALDLSIQSQILNLLVDLQEKLDLAYLFISHDLSVVKHMADEVLVMYLGRPVEIGPKEQVFATPRHPYTKALLSATPTADPLAKKNRIKLEGELPSPLNLPKGCAFSPRCAKAKERCTLERPELDEKEHQVACFFPEAS